MIALTAFMSRHGLIPMPRISNVLFVMDEPTVGLDPEERLRFREIVQRISGERIIVISSHEIRELEHMCENMIFLHRGQVLCVSSIESLQEKYMTEDMEEIYFRIFQKRC